MSGVMDMATTALKVAVSIFWVSTVPILMPLMRTSAPLGSPPTLVNEAWS